MSEKRLQGLRVAVLVVDGFEQVEVTIPMRALRRASADVRIVSLRPGRIRGMNFLFRGKKLPVDDLVSRARPEEYGALLLPGGFVNPDLLRQSGRLIVSADDDTLTLFPALNIARSVVHEGLDILERCL